MKTKLIQLLMLLICIAAALCSCNSDIVSSYVNDKNEIIGVYADGEEKVLGQAVSVVGTKINEDFHVVVEYSDGTTKDLGYVGVIDEKLNIEVEKTTINEEFHVIVEFSNGTIKDLGYVGVIDPSKNVEVEKTSVNEDFHLVIEFTDGTIKDMGYVGMIDPTKSIEVDKTQINDAFHLIVTFTDGSTKDMGYVGVIDPALNVDVEKTTVNDNFHLIVTFTDGTTKDMGYVAVIDPSKNVEVNKTTVNDEFHLIITLTDGTTKDMGYVGVIDPSKNVELEKSLINDELHLILTFTDGSTKDMGYVGVTDESLNVTVIAIEVNDEMHLIVTYSNGTTEDLGYVGVEVEPPLYIVTFVDYYGKTLKVQEVYRGKSAKAPEAPAVTDMVFAGWDLDYTNVQSDMTIRPTYNKAAEYIVTFKDADGTVLKTQIVISGHSATAPSVSNKEDSIFTGWDKSFSNVKSDLVVTAQYRAKQTYTVTFNDYTGLTLGTATVKEGDTAKAPTTPDRDGYKFVGWSSSLNNITSNKTVTAKYSLNTGKNIVDVSYKINSNNTVTVTLAVKGTVKFCGIEGYVEIPEGLNYKNNVAGDGTIANYSDGVVYFSFTTLNAKDTTNETMIMTVTLGYENQFTSAKLNTVVSDIYDQSFNTVEFNVIGGEIRVK